MALYIACCKLITRNILQENPVKYPIAAVSLGIVGGKLYIDLNYEEDFCAEVDMNLVANSEGQIVEIQGTSEKKPFSPEQLHEMVTLGLKGIGDIIAIQKKVLGL